MRKREEGNVQRHFGAAAREIVAERAAKKRKSIRPVAIACVDPSREPKKVDAIYTAFLECRANAGESTDGMSRAKFEQFLKRKVEELRKENSDGEVEFVADLEGGKARLRARIKNLTIGARLPLARNSRCRVPSLAKNDPRRRFSVTTFFLAAVQ